MSIKEKYKGKNRAIKWQKVNAEVLRACLAFFDCR
jgi:hypothetical protein